MSVRCGVCRGSWETADAAQRAHSLADMFDACPYHAFAQENPDATMSAATQRLADMAGPGVIGMLMWIDPAGTRWIAPLGSTSPGYHPDGLSPEWLPIQIQRRTDML